jgi:hypothetical protein
VAQDSISRWIEGRGFPPHEIGRLWKFKLSEVDAWVRAGGTDVASQSKTTNGKRGVRER